MSAKIHRLFFCQNTEKPLKFFMFLYTHIPFCASKCRYCDFLSGFSPEEALKKRYISALLLEASLYAKTNFRMESLYLGGGTPSLLSGDEIRSLVEGYREIFSFDEDAEFTLEANPDDITEEIAAVWKDLGFNRISLGFQSMNDATLKLLGRRNTAEQNLRAFEILQNAGFENLSFDIILGVRGDDSLKSLQTVKELSPAHVSCYHLSIEPNTQLVRMLKSGRYKSLSDEEFLKASDSFMNGLIDLGYERYEISNFARNGFVSKHNLNYWKSGEYLGLGLGSSGYFDGLRYVNRNDFEGYFHSVENGELPSTCFEKIEGEIERKEFIMLRMRLKEGFSFEEFEKKFGFRFPIEKTHFLSKYFIANEKRLAFNQEGFELSNRIISHLWEIMESDIE